MTPRDLLLSILTGALAALIGWVYLGLSAETQRRWKIPLLAACGVAIAAGIGIMIVAFLA